MKNMTKSSSTMSVKSGRLKCENSGLYIFDFYKTCNSNENCNFTLKTTYVFPGV